MSVFSAMNTAVAGLGAQSKAMGNISDNIANSRTIGYKRTDTNFRDLVTTSNVMFHSPGAVTATPHFANTVQGDLLQSDIGTNVAISGAGFFAVSKATKFTNNSTTFGSEPLFTRRGDFSVDRQGYLVNGAGYYLRGKQVINQDTFATTDTLSEVNVSAVTLPPERTRQINYNANLPSTPAPVDASKFVTTDTNGRAQEDTLQLFGTLEAGDVYTVSVGTTTVNYTVTGAEGSLAGVRNNLVNALNTALTAAGVPVTASSYGADKIKLNSNAIGTPFTTTVSTTNVTPVAQVDVVRIGGTPDVGDTYNLQITDSRGTLIDQISYLVPASPAPTITSIRDGLVSKMQTDPNITNRLIVQSDGTDRIKLTSIVPGQSFTTTPSVIDGGTAAVGTLTGPVQVDTLTIGASVTGGDAYNVAVTDANGVAIGSVSFTAPAAPGNTVANVQAGLIAALQGNAAINARFDIVANGANKVDIIDHNTNTTTSAAFTATSTVTGTGTLTRSTTPRNVPSTADNYLTKNTTKPNVAIGSPASASLPILASLPISAPINVGTAIANGTSVSISPEDFNANTLSGGVITIYDQVGTPMDVQLRWMSRGNDQWQMYYYDPQYQFGNSQPTWVPVLGAIGMQFSQGRLTSSAVYTNVAFTQGGRSITVDNLSFAGPTGTDPGMTEYSDSDISVHRLDQNGSRTGNMTNVTIDEKGYVTALFDNGLNRKMYQIPVAMFNNADALDRHDGAAFTTTEGSGSPHYEAMGRNGAGSINASSLENSNVDIADQFTKMIVAQRVYSANARTITTSDEMLQEVIGLKR